MADQPEDSGRDPIAEDIEAMTNRVASIEGDALVHRVRAGMTVRARHRRRNVRIVTASAAAAVLLGVTVFAVLAAEKPAIHVTQSMDFGERVSGGQDVLVDPDENLHDGQKVDVTAFGFDVGTTVKFLQCGKVDVDSQPHVVRPDASEGPATAPDDLPHWVCQGTPDDGGVKATSRDFDNAGAPHTIATGTMKLALDQTRFQVPLIEEQGTWTVGSADQARDLAPYCAPVAFPADTSAPDSTSAATDTTEVGSAPTCVVAALGQIDGKTVLKTSAPLRFATEVPGAPTPGGAIEPGHEVTTAPTSPTKTATTPSGLPDVCSDGVDHAELKVSQLTSDAKTVVLADKIVSGDEPARLLRTLCEQMSGAPAALDEPLTACPLVGPEVPYATVTFTYQASPVTDFMAGVAGCAYLGGDQIPPVYALGNQLAAYRRGISAIGHTFDFDLTTALRDQPTSRSTVPSTTSGG